MVRPVKIMTDSTSDLSNELVEQYKIEVIPLYINMGGESYRDGVDIQPTDLFEYTDKTRDLAKSAATTPNDFKEVFQLYIDRGYDIFYTGISSKLSSTLQNAFIAKKEVEDKLDEERIFLVDSLSLSTGIGLLVLEAAERAESDMAGEQIAKEITELVPKVQAGFFVDTLRYLYYGGRCSALAAMIGGALKLRPRLILKEGKIIPGQKYHGSWDKSMKGYYADVVGTGQQIHPKRVFVTHTADPEKAQKVKDMLEQQLAIEEIVITTAGSVISSHCGPGTLGILYLEQ